MAAKALLLGALGSVALALPVDERQTCSAQWGQCAGIGYTGPTCCPSGWSCVYSNDWYSQCLQVTTTTTTTTTAAKTTSSTTTAKSTSSTTTSKASTTASTTTGTKTTTTTTGGTKTTTTAVGSGSGTASWSGNPFSGVNQWANSYYASEVNAYAVPTLGAAASAVAEVPSFMWLDTYSKIALMQSTLADIRTANAKASTPNAGIFVVYDLPDRDCAAAASNGEYSIANNGVANYYAYIDAIVAVVKAYSDIRILLVIEPDSLANLVTNLGVAKCANAESAYLQCVNYAITQLNLPNVAMYLDAGHAGWLGWAANLQPAANLFAQVWSNAGKPAGVRGLATNVANYNAWSIATAPSYTSGDSNYDESLYVQALQPLLVSQGWTDVHFITDQSRSGKQPTGQLAWGDWCNVIGTGFGTRPTTNTGLAIEDAFVWVKPGGECDGTSNTSSSRYDYHCGLADALQPAPEAGTWFEAYFEQLYNNANPAF